MLSTMLMRLTCSRMKKHTPKVNSMVKATLYTKLRGEMERMNIILAHLHRAHDELMQRGAQQKTHGSARSG